MKDRKGLSARNKKRNNHKETRKVSNENLKDSSYNTPKRCISGIEFERCPIQSKESNEKLKKLTLLKFKGIGKNLNVRLQNNDSGTKLPSPFNSNDGSASDI